jgi:ribosome-associated protein
MARKPFHEVEESGRLREETLSSDRTVRWEHREEMEALKALANRIAKLPPSQRRALPLDEEALEQFDNLANSALKPERRRSLMRAKLLLAHADMEAIHLVLDGGGPALVAAQAAESWRNRIVAGDDGVLNTFLSQHPSGDRQALRSAAREARGGDTPGAKRAARRCLELVRAALDPGAPAEADEG